MIGEKIWIEGPVGKLEGIMARPYEEKTSLKCVGLLCHPHPLQGGSMNNKVITTLSRAFQEVGASAVRFNYRGVGQSEGQYGDFLGETADAGAALTWVRERFPDYRVVVGGFSFGGAVAIRLAQAQPVDHLMTIAPALHLMDYDINMTFDFPWLLVQGWEDEIIDTRQILQWCQSLSTKPQVWCLPGASHFFHGKLVSLKKQIGHYLLDSLS